MFLVFDESGSWGKRQERFFVIGGFITSDHNRIKTVMRRALKKVKQEYPVFNGCQEIKAKDAPPIVKDYVLRKLTKEDIIICYIAIDKKHALAGKGKEQNRFYNYQLGLLAQYIRRGNHFDEFNFIIDNRTIRTGSLNLFEDYMHIKLNYELSLPTNINVNYRDSIFYEIQAADYICNALWTRENYPSTDYYSDLIWSKVKTRLKFPLSKFGQ